MDEDVFGGSEPVRKTRPTHPDFFRLAEVVLQNDGKFEGMPVSEHDAQIGRMIAEVGDSYSVSYMAMQRTMRILGIVTARDLIAKQAELEALSALWVDGFLAGAGYEKRGGAQEPKGR